MGGGHHHSAEAMPVKEQDLQLLKDNQIPLALRDNCAHLLVKLNTCRMQTAYNPAKCTHQRHTYEECEYIAWSDRVDAKKKMKAEALAAAKAAEEAS